MRFARRLRTLARPWAVVVCATIGMTLLPAARSWAPSRSLAFGGHLYTPDGGSLEGVRVVATDSRGSYEALVDSSGLFVGAFPTEPIGPVTLRVFMDSAPRYHTSVVSVGRGAPGRHARIVVVPTRWTIRGGSLDGRQVRIDPVQATARVADGVGYWRLTKRGHLAGRAVTWLADSLPVRVAFRRERHDPRIAPEDSAQFWSRVVELEQHIGRALFRPASFEEVEAGGDGIFVTIDRRMAAAGRTFITYDPSGRIYEALISVSRREYLTESRIATHELLHAIGMGHTGAWSSVMSPLTRGVDTPTPDDIAYAQLYYAISTVQRERDAPFGIMEVVRDVRY